jgi:C_GCAxxG_C_C family probable redox protein
MCGGGSVSDGGGKGEMGKREDLIQRAQQLGFEYERTYQGCGQCSIAALQDTFGIRNDDVFKAATAFAAGVGQAGDGCCGAYLGAAMTISSLRGRTRGDFSDPQDVRKEAYRMVRQVRQRFIDEYGSVICRDIHTKIFGRPFYLPDPDERAKFEAAGAHVDKCPSVVGNAAGWAAAIILDEALVTL